MGNLLFVKKVRISTFYKKRVSRIFPALYFYLFAITVVLALTGRHGDAGSIRSVFLLYFNYYAAAMDLRVPVEYQHVWSLCIEEHCYILLSLLAVAARRWPVKDWVLVGSMVLVSWAFAAVYTATTDWDYYHLFWRTEARLGAVFCSAALVCWLNDGHGPIVRGPWVALPLLGGLALQLQPVPDLLKYTLGTALLSVAVTHFKFAAPWLVRPYRMRWLVLLGVVSYSTYLWQQPFMALREHGHGAIFLAGALTVGALSYYLLENPARRWINAHWAGEPSPPP